MTKESASFLSLLKALSGVGVGFHFNVDDYIFHIMTVNDNSIIAVEISVCFKNDKLNIDDLTRIALETNSQPQLMGITIGDMDSQGNISAEIKVTGNRHPFHFNSIQFLKEVSTAVCCLVTFLEAVNFETEERELPVWLTGRVEH